MITLSFTGNIQRHVRCPDMAVIGGDVRECLEAYFKEIPHARSYILTDQNQLRKHMNIFINNTQIQDRHHMSDAVHHGDEIFILQALSGGA